MIELLEPGFGSRAWMIAARTTGARGGGERRAYVYDLSVVVRTYFGSQLRRPINRNSNSPLVLSSETSQLWYCLLLS
jgi:hypothetical protein